jgi:hypothetical protein
MYRKPAWKERKSFVEKIIPLAKFPSEHGFQCEIEMGSKFSMPRVAHLIVTENRAEK